MISLSYLKMYLTLFKICPGYLLVHSCKSVCFWDLLCSFRHVLNQDILGMFPIPSEHWQSLVQQMSSLEGFLCLLPPDLVKPLFQQGYPFRRQASAINRGPVNLISYITTIKITWIYKIYYNYCYYTKTSRLVNHPAHVLHWVELRTFCWHLEDCCIFDFQKHSSTLGDDRQHKFLDTMLWDDNVPFD